MRTVLSMDQIRQLPRLHEETIPESYLDEMGHMNVRWYMVLFSSAARELSARAGMDRSYFAAGVNGTFAMEQFFRYLDEIRVGERVAVHTRIVDVDEKRLHLFHFLVNETRESLATTQESLITHVDLRARRSSRFPEEVLRKIEATHREHAALSWTPDLSGAIAIRRRS